MNLKENAKVFIEKVNPIDIHRKQVMRSRLLNTTPSFLCPNCIGGILFHDLGLEFRSPTINLMMYQRDFVKFVLNLDSYLQEDLRFFSHAQYSFPCAHLGDLTIHFTHYKAQEDAEKKWESRIKKIDRDNLFIFLEERDGLSQTDIENLGHIHARGLVVFTANKYPNIPYALQIPKYSRFGEVGNILKKSYLSGKHEYEHFFDFVKWFNEANGNFFDISPFSLTNAKKY